MVPGHSLAVLSRASPSTRHLAVKDRSLQLALSSALYTELTAQLKDANGSGISFFTPHGQDLHYNQLLAWDANRVQLEASLAYTPGQITLRVDDQWGSLSHHDRSAHLQRAEGGRSRRSG